MSQDGGDPALRYPDRAPYNPFVLRLVRPDLIDSEAILPGEAVIVGVRSGS